MENLCIFIGNLGSTPELKTLEDGTKVLQISIACTERGYKKKDGREVPERTEWIPIVAWRSQAEYLASYARKGSRIYVKGKFRTRTYEDRNGNKQWRTDIYADDVQILDNRREEAPLPPDISKGSTPGMSTQPVETSQPTPSDVPYSSGDKDDLPF